MGFDHFKVGKAGAAFRHSPSSSAPAKRADAATTPDPSCANGAFYKSPILSNTYDSSMPMNVVWDPTLNCILPAPKLVDIYLDRPGADNSKMHAWTGVPYAQGNYTLNLQPSWWNSTASISAQVMIAASGTPVFLTPMPAGPVITVTYTAPTNGSVPAAADPSTQGSDTTVVTPTAVAGISAHHMSAGKKAAAVLLPLLFVILLGLAYVKISRARGASKRSEWSEKLDKRMSTISADWRSVTLSGAKAAVRQSMAQRNSSAFSFGAIRPGEVEGEPVVMGEKPVVRGGSIDIDAQDIPRTSLGSGVGVGVGARRPRTHGTPPDRSSRAVSFADAAHPRPSLSSAYSRGSRAFHTGSTYNEFDGEEAPPVPALPSPSRSGAYGGERRSSGSGGAGNGNRVASVYNGNGTAWSSGERVEGIDGGYGAQCVSPTGRVHTVAYPSPPAGALSANGFAYGDANDQQNSYFSPTTPTPTSMFVVPDPSEVYTSSEPSADSAYAATTFGEYDQGYSHYGSPSESDVSSGMPSVMTSPSQTAGPLNLTSEDIRRRMTTHHGQNGEGAWRQSVDEVFGALSMMRTGNSPSSPDGEDEGGEYLFAPMPETVFAYPGTPAASSFNSSAAPSSPFAMPMSAPTMSPDDMLRAYAAKHASTTATPSPLSKTTTGAEVVPTLQNTGMRILYKQPDASGRARTPSVAGSGGLIRAGKGARLSK